MHTKYADSIDSLVHQHSDQRAGIPGGLDTAIVYTRALLALASAIVFVSTAGCSTDGVHRTNGRFAAAVLVQGVDAVSFPRCVGLVRHVCGMLGAKAETLPVEQAPHVG